MVNVMCGTEATDEDWLVFPRARNRVVVVGYANRVTLEPGDPAVVFACDTEVTRLEVADSYPIVTTAPVGPVMVVSCWPVYPNAVVLPSASTIDVRFEDGSFTHFSVRDEEPDVCVAVKVRVDDEYASVAVRAATGPALLTTLFGLPGLAYPMVVALPLRSAMVVGWPSALNVAT
ncbi:hypothetical protein [Microbacterium sp. NPDC087589]|uniref:hypothetical protein n=1 Tax=Microbacterium sp. NPDC087589 TaxID=3364191 RepID=UPI00380D52A4